MTTTEAIKRFEKARQALLLEQARLERQGRYASLHHFEASPVPGQRDLPERLTLSAQILRKEEAQLLHLAWGAQAFEFCEFGDCEARFSWNNEVQLFFVHLTLCMPAVTAGLDASPATVDQAAA